MKNIDEIKAAAPRVFLQPTFDYLTAFGKKRNFKIVSSMPPIADLDCSIEKGERCFTYQTEMMARGISLVEYQARHYGLMGRFELLSQQERLIAVSGARSSSIAIGQGMTASGEITHLERDFAPEKPCYFRALIPFAKFSHKLMDYVSSSPFHTEGGFRGGGYMQIGVNDKDIALFDYRSDPVHYMIFDCYSLTTYSEFELLLGAVCYVSGLITGSLVRDEVYIVQSKDKAFQHLTGIQFRQVEESLDAVPAIAPRIAREVSKAAVTTYMDKSILAALVSGCLQDERLLRAIKLMTESTRAPMQIRAASFSVALETMKNIIILANEEKVTPMEKAFGRKVIKELKIALNTYPAETFKNKAMVVKKIDNLNQVGNTEAFQLCFELVGIKLQKSELDCIRLRNDFLHGRIPFEDEVNQDHLLLQRITLQLHQLVCGLILKYKGFSGQLINNMTYIELQNGWAVTGPLFRAI